LVIGQGMALVSAGVVIGVAAAWALTRLMATMLFETPATDPTTFVLIALLLAAVALAACWIPARRGGERAPPGWPRPYISASFRRRRGWYLSFLALLCGCGGSVANLRRNPQNPPSCQKPVPMRR